MAEIGGCRSDIPAEKSDKTVGVVVAGHQGNLFNCQVRRQKQFLCCIDPKSL